MVRLAPAQAPRPPRAQVNALLRSAPSSPPARHQKRDSPPRQKTGQLPPSLPTALWPRSALALLRALIGPGGKAGKTVFRGAGLPGYWATAAVYLTAYAMRMGLYVLHAKGVLLRHLAALLPPSALAAMFPDAATSGHLMSDHLVLAASTGAQLVTELAVCVDALGWLHASKPSERGAGSERKLSRRRTALLVAVTAANAALLLLLLCDMAVTARFFHAPPETLVSFVVGWPFFYVVTSALL